MIILSVFFDIGQSYVKLQIHRRLHVQPVASCAKKRAHTISFFAEQVIEFSVKGRINQLIESIRSEILVMLSTLF